MKSIYTFLLAGALVFALCTLTFADSKETKKSECGIELSHDPGTVIFDNSNFERPIAFITLAAVSFERKIKIALPVYFNNYKCDVYVTNLNYINKTC